MRKLEDHIGPEELAGFQKVWRPQARRELPSSCFSISRSARSARNWLSAAARFTDLARSNLWCEPNALLRMSGLSWLKASAPNGPLPCSLTPRGAAIVPPCCARQRV